MLNFIFISLAFSAGLAAFFSPCAVSLLPAYISYYLGKQNKNKKTYLRDSLMFSFQTILGFFTIFGLVGILVLTLGQFIKSFIPGIAIVTGFILIITGFLMLFGKNLSLNLKHKIPISNAYAFGIAYGIGALGCTFPLFLSVVLQGIVDKMIFNGFISLLAYILGISIMMVVITLLTAFAKKFVEKKIAQVLPITLKISALILILAGTYMIYYQWLSYFG